MADISLKDPLQEIYEEVSPVEYRWKKYEKEAPKMDDDFKWNFLSEIKQPQLEIKGPSVGSLLYALNPQTSELGLKQMDSELNQQLQANEMFDKRGEEALDFMEKRVQEDIAKKKLQNIDAGHANSLLANYTQAIQSGDATAIAINEDRIRKTFPNADAILEQAKSQASLNMKQKENANKFNATLPRGDGWTNSTERNAWIANIDTALADGKIDEKSRNELVREANSIKDRESERKNVYRQAYNAAGASKSVEQNNAKDYTAAIEKLKKRYGSEVRAKAAYDRGER